MKHMLSLLLAVLLSSTLQAQVYEWFDESGNRHFSDKKPEGVAFRTLGDPSATLSGYKAVAIQQPPSSAPNRDAGTSSSDQIRRSRPAIQESEAVCADYLAQIDAIHDRLRAGYAEPLGNRLRAKRSALRRAYRKDCN